jgi:hypothetical protein
MDYLIVNGNPNPADKNWETYLSDFAARLTVRGSCVKLFTLRDLDIKPCTGCFSCWLITPGLCARRDDMKLIYPAVLGSDLLIWASPLVLGNVSALTKIAQDRFLPLLHPYFVMREGEVHHRIRYSKIPDLGLILGLGRGDTEEDVALVRRLHERFALNFYSRLRFTITNLTTAAESVRLVQEAMHETIAA